MTAEINLNAPLNESPSTDLETVLLCIVADLMKRLELTGTWIDIRPFDEDDSLLDYYLSGVTDDEGDSTGLVYLSKGKITELPQDD